MAFINEFAHPSFIVHFNPVDGNSFRKSDLQEALRLQAHALELDLYRDHRDLHCGDADGMMLQEVFDHLLLAKGESSTMYGDGLQFFLVLDPKDTDHESVDLLWSILQTYKTVLSPHLSTMPFADPAPRGMTMVLTGEKAVFNRYKGEAFNELCVLEESESLQQLPPLINVNPATPFRWWESLDHSASQEQGKVNSLHQQGFNVRTYGAESDLYELGLQLAAGVDSVNCHAESFIDFRGGITSQNPLGSSPSLALRGSQGLLAWRQGNYLYLAWSAQEISFRRPLNLTWFLQEKPLAQPPAVAIAPDGRFIVVYEGTDGARLWYISGRFTQSDRFITFDGGQKLLTKPDNSRRGHNPAVAIGPDGHVIIVYEGTGDQRLWYVSGSLDPSGTFVGTEFELSQGDSRRGSTPSIAIDGSSVIIVYRGTAEERIWYVSGTIEAAGGQIAGREFRLMTGDAGRGYTPSVAITQDSRVLVVYQGTSDDRLWYVTGYRRDSQIVGKEFELTVENSIRGTHPTAAIDSNGDAIILYEGTSEQKLWYVRGKFSGPGWLTVPMEFLLDMGFTDPT